MKRTTDFLFRLRRFFGLTTPEKYMLRRYFLERPFALERFPTIQILEEACFRDHITKNTFLYLSNKLASFPAQTDFQTAVLSEL